MSSHEDYKQWIVSADSHSLIQQFNAEVRGSLVSAQNLVSLLSLMAHPSPGMQQKIDSGELNQEEMINQVAAALDQVLSILDFYRESLGLT